MRADTFLGRNWCFFAMQPYSQYLTCKNTTISEPWVEEPNIFSLTIFQFSSLAIQIKASQFLSHLINIWIQGEVNEGFKVSWICASVACIWSSQLLTYLGFSQDHVFDRFVLQSLMHLLHLLINYFLCTARPSLACQSPPRELPACSV